MADLTNEAAEALGRRWIAAGGGWRAGMQAGWDKVKGRLVANLGTLEWRSETHYGQVPDFVADAERFDAWPDLRDPATRGACLEVVRERWGDPAMHLRPVAAGWGAFSMRDSLEGDAPTPLYLCIAAPTEAEALVVALESAPKEPT